MKVNQMIVTAAIAIVFVVALVAARNLIEGNYNNDISYEANVAENINNGEGGVQVVKLSYVDYVYRLEPSVMVKGVPVRMEVDTNTVTGCMQYVVINAFNVKKFVDNNDNIIEFTPDRTGTFTIACSMGMGKNTFTVVDNDGQKSDYVETQAAVLEIGGSCGGSGGCGCGGRKF